MRLWAEALDIAHATRMKLISIETLCRGVTAFGNPVRGAYDGASERHQHAAVRLICQTGHFRPFGPWLAQSLSRIVVTTRSGPSDTMTKLTPSTFMPVAPSGAER